MSGSVPVPMPAPTLAPLTTCINVYGSAPQVAVCTHVDDASAWMRRHDCAPSFVLLNAFLSVQFGLVSAPAHAYALSALPIVAASLVYAALVEASVVGSALLGAPAISLRGAWGDSEPFTLSLALALAGAALGVLHAHCARAPPLFVLDAPLEPSPSPSPSPSAMSPSPWRNARYAVQYAVLLATSFYFVQGADASPAAAAQRWLRHEWRAYALMRTLALLVIYAWNRVDDANRDLVHGSAAHFDAVWLRLGVSYAAQLAVGAYAWGVAWQRACAQLGVGVLIALATRRK